VSNNINVDILKELNAHFSDKNYIFSSYENEVKSNVAIAAAVTAYARIHMIKYKLKEVFIILILILFLLITN
jgi:hypothetical protein